MRPRLAFSDLLRGQDFSGSFFEHGWFQTVDFSDCNFTEARFNDCSFPHVRFDGACLHGADFVSDHSTYMVGVSLAACDLTNCNFGNIYTDYRREGPSAKDRISFTGAKLHGTRFRDADLRRADFTGCIGFDDIMDLEGANLLGATGLTSETLEIARRKGATC